MFVKRLMIMVRIWVIAKLLRLFIFGTLGFIPKEKCEDEVDWFFNKLGIVERFFYKQNFERIVEYIHSIYASKIKALTKFTDADKGKGSYNNSFLFKVEHIFDGGAIMLCNSQPGEKILNCSYYKGMLFISNYFCSIGISVASGPQFEKKIDAEYLHNDELVGINTYNNSDKYIYIFSSLGDVYRVETYRSKGSVGENMESQLRCYFVEKCIFLNSGVSPLKSKELNIKLLSSTRLLEMANERLLSDYEALLKTAVLRKGPVSSYRYREKSGKDISCRLFICYKRGRSLVLFEFKVYIFLLR
jgi:glutamate dehydrogenase